MAMKNYDIQKPGTLRSIGHAGTVTNTAIAGRVIFTCNTAIGNYVNPTPHFFTKSDYSYGYGIDVTDTCYQGAYKLVGSAGSVNSNAVLHLIDPNTFESEISDRAMEKIYDLIKGNSNFVVDLAESSTTLRMLKGTINLKKTLFSFFTEFLSPKTRHGRGLPTRGQKRLDYMSAKWLEFRYGWSPLVHSIYDAMDTLGGEHLIRGVYPVKGRASVKKRVQSFTGSGSYTSPKVTSTTEASSRIEYCYLFAHDPSSRVYDWTTLNPVKVAWELTPLSFVADWVANVSQQLSLWENYLLFNSRVKDGYVTRTRLIETSSLVHGFTKGTYMSWPNGSFIDGAHGDKTKLWSAGTRTTSLNRQVTKSLPLPGGIRLNVSFGAKRQLDAAGLIHQIVVKRFR